MRLTTPGWLAALCIAALPSASFAADSGELKALREEVARMRQSYEQRIEALEQRLSRAETTAGQAQAAATGAASAAASAATAAGQAETTARGAESAAAKAETVASAAGVAATSRPSSATAFNPALSLILAGTYTNLKVDPLTRPYAISGFVPSNGEVAPPPRSFSLGESELAISANVDHVFRGALFLADRKSVV